MAGVERGCAEEVAVDGAALVRTTSVVIPAYNAADVVGEQLAALRAQDAAWIHEVLVVDSLSTDATADVVRSVAKQWPKVRLVSAERPGANVARNAGIAASSADAVLLCDADDVVAPGWAESLFVALQTHDLVRGRYELTALNSPETIAARGEVASTISPPPHRPLEGLGGSCGFRRSVWFELKGLRSHHYGADDIEFFWRAHQAGHRIQYVEDAVVHYRLREGMRPLFRQQLLWASSRALLLKEFGADGPIARRNLRAGLRAWAWLLVHGKDALSTDPTRRGRWMRAAANAIGRVRGSVKHRVWYV